MDRSKWKQHIVGLIVNLTAVIVGTLMAWTATISDDLANGKLNNITMSTDELGWVGSFVTVGFLVITIPIGILCEWYGSKITTLVCLVPCALGWLMIILSEQIEVIYAGRFLTGIAGGAFSVTAPIYSVEIAQKEERGTLGSYFQVFLTLGILFANSMGFLTSMLTYNIICASLPILVGVMIMTFPETPLYLTKMNKIEAAKKSLRDLRGMDYDVDREISEIQKDFQDEKCEKLPFFESLKKVSTRKAMFICYGLIMIQNFAGLNAMMFYTSTIFEEANIDINSGVASMIVTGMQLITTCIFTPMVDRLGRRILLLYSNALLAIATLLFSLFYTLQGQGYRWGWLPIVALGIYFVGYSVGYGLVPWILALELFPGECRNILNSTVIMLNWVLAFFITKYFLTVREAVGAEAVFYFFTVCASAGFIFVYVFVTETKGKSFQEIQDELNGIHPKA